MLQSGNIDNHRYLRQGIARHGDSAMAFQTANQCAEVVMNFSTSGKAMANVCNFHNAGTYAPSDLQDLADAVDTIIDSDYLPLISSGTLYNSVDVRGLQDENDYVRSSAVNAGPGTASGSALNSNASLCVTLRSAFTGRSARGRFFAMPTVVGNTSAADTYSSGYGDGVVDFLELLQTTALPLGWTFVVLSRFNSGVKRASAVPFAITDIGYRNLKADSQRNRLPSGH